MPKHPYENAEYKRLEGARIHVRDLDSGREGIFALGGKWLSGDIRHADHHYMRYVYDMAAPVAAITPGLRKVGD